MINMPAFKVPAMKVSSSALPSGSSKTPKLSMAAAPKSTFKMPKMSFTAPKVPKTTTSSFKIAKYMTPKIPKVAKMAVLKKAVKNVGY
jgi:hypothetical protein